MVYIDEQIKKYKRNGSELIDGEKFVYAHERIIIPVIMHCRTPESCKFKRSLEFILHDVRNKQFLGNSKRKPNKIWVDQGSEFYNSQFKTFLKDNDIKMYSTCNKRKSVVA